MFAVHGIHACLLTGRCTEGEPVTEDQLKSILVSVQSKTIARRDVAALINFCRHLAGTLLLHQRTSILLLCEHEGVSVFDLEVDIIADIFAKNGDGRFFELEKFISSFPSLRETDAGHLYLAFKKIVLKKASSRLYKTYAEADPVGAKIRRNLSEGAKRSPALELIDGFRGKVLQLKSDNTNPHQSKAGVRSRGDFRPELPPDVLERELLSRMNHSFNIPDILAALSSVFCDRRSQGGVQQYRRSVLLTDLVQIVRKFYAGTDGEPPIEPEPGFSADGFAAVEKDVLLFINKIIFQKYFPKKISNREDAEKLFFAVKEIIAGFRQTDGSRCSVEQSVRKSFSLTHEEYQQQWRTQAEYLVKLAKEQFALLLNDTM